MIDFSSYRTNDIENNLSKMNIRPLDVMVTGVTGAGKSTTLNAFFQKNVAKVGDGVDPETMELDSYSLNDAFRLWDTPGLGDGIAKDQVHKKKLVDLLYKVYVTNPDQQRYGWIDMVLVIIEGGNRDMGTTYTLLNEVIVPNIQRDRILVAINQADFAMKGYHWNHSFNAPDAELYAFLENQALSIQRRVREATGVNILKPVYYSAQYSWNIDKLFDFIIDNMPTCRRSLFFK
ncbi:50S ribosome-binding GTPase [Phascolarctobacterium sp. ET69]|nr:50S ribosome-binding GTPase [Phascolarctobacterium sp. ET69]